MKLQDTGSQPLALLLSGTICLSLLLRTQCFWETSASLLLAHFGIARLHITDLGVQELQPCSCRVSTSSSRQRVEQTQGMMPQRFP